MSEIATHNPEQAEVFGLPAEPLISGVIAADCLVGIARDDEGRRLRVLPPYVGYGALRTVAEIVPLIESTPVGGLQPEDVRPYAGAILDNIVTSEAAIQRATPDMAQQLRLLRSVRWVPGVRGYALKRIEEEFPDHVQRHLRSGLTRHYVQRGLDRAQPCVDILAGFENPKEQFVEELGVVMGGVRWHAEERRAQRLAAAEATPARGLRARVSRWRQVRKAKKLTTEDAGHGIEQVMQEVLSNDNTETPMLRAIIESALAETERTKEDLQLPTIQKRILNRDVTLRPAQYLGAVAPDILRTVNAPLQDTWYDDTAFIEALKPTGLRRLVRFMPNGDLRTFRFWAPRLTRHIKEVLPESGQAVREVPERIRNLFSKKAVSGDRS